MVLGGTQRAFRRAGSGKRVRETKSQGVTTTIARLKASRRGSKAVAESDWVWTALGEGVGGGKIKRYLIEVSTTRGRRAAGGNDCKRFISISKSKEEKK